MKRFFFLLLMLLPLCVTCQSWLNREDTYWFAGTGVDLRNATIGGTVNDVAYDGTFSIGYRNAGFSIMAYYETFAAI